MSVFVKFFKFTKTDNDTEIMWLSEFERKIHLILSNFRQYLNKGYSMECIMQEFNVVYSKICCEIYSHIEKIKENFRLFKEKFYDIIFLYIMDYLSVDNTEKWTTFCNDIKDMLDLNEIIQQHECMIQ